MLSVAFAATLVAVVMAARIFRARARFKSARTCLWLALFLALLALKSGWVPSDVVALSALIAFIIYVTIQDMRIAKEAKPASSGEGRD